MASGGGASILGVKTGASILGVGMGASATGETLCGGREGFAPGCTSWKVRSSIGAALRCVNPRNCDSALIPARHSSFTDDARARRVAADDLGVFAADSGDDDGDGACPAARFEDGAVSPGCGAAESDDST